MTGSDNPGENTKHDARKIMTAIVVPVFRIGGSIEIGTVLGSFVDNLCTN